MAKHLVIKQNMYEVLQLISKVANSNINYIYTKMRLLNRFK